MQYTNVTQSQLDRTADRHRRLLVPRGAPRGKNHLYMHVNGDLQKLTIENSKKK